MDTAASSPSPGRSRVPTAAHPEVRVVIGGRHRLIGRLDHALLEPPEDPAIDDVVAAAKPHTDAFVWMLDGGEPTLRGDFPHLVRALAQAGAPALGLITDGQALANPKVPPMLEKLGVDRVRVRVHSARHDAHDWLVDTKGAWKRAVRALRVCAQAGLIPEVECTVTRPTRPYLEEAVELFARLGVKTVVLRRVTGRGPARADDVAVLPRLGLAQGDLERAVQTGVRLGLDVRLDGFPRCAAPGVAAQHVPTDTVVWAVPETGGFRFLRPRFEPVDHEPGCARCPGPPACAGAPSDYLRRHGRTEIDSEGNTYVRPRGVQPTPLAGGDTPPPPREGRFPPARLAYVRATAKMDSMGGDPLVAVAAAERPERYRFVFLAPSRVSDPVLGDHPGPTEAESTRAARVRLVKVAQHGAKLLRIASAGSLAHPQAAELLREATRLEFDRVEVAGEGSALAGFSDMQLRRLRGIHRLDVALYGPDAERHDAIAGDGAFDATMEALDRLSNLVPSLKLGCYGVLTSHDDLADYAEAWDFGDLPGAPWFRLAPRGGSLDALAAAASELPEGPSRDAIAAVLPRALFPHDTVVPAPQARQAWGDVPAAYGKPSGSDRFGCYTGGPTSADEAEPGACPGYAVGWTADHHTP